MLYTNLRHIESSTDYANVIQENEHVMIICGRMDPICIPVYRIAEELEEEYIHVNFFDMELDNPQSEIIRYLPEVEGLKSTPLLLYFKNGQIIKATSGIQTKAQMTVILENEFSEILSTKS